MLDKIFKINKYLYIIVLVYYIPCLMFDFYIIMFRKHIYFLK